jgi:tetratricopeptide (TPR) repeat protein
MPTTYNGIGTQYYGNRNKTTHFGFCNQCKREQMLTDYETTLFFCVIYIPLIPISKKQIVNQCPACTYHYAVPLTDWKKKADEAVEQVSETLAQDTNDPAKAMEMHATLSGFHRHEESAELTEVLLAKFGDNSEVLFYLASWHEHFARFKEADALFVKASDREPADMDKQAAAVFALARQNEFDASLQRMKLLNPPAIPDRISLVRHVARQLGANGRAADAYPLLTQLLQQAPQLKNDRELQREVRQLEWQLGVKQSVVPAAPMWQRPIAKWFAVTTAAVIALVALEGWNLYVQQNAPIYAVNGVNAPIQFSVDGGTPQSIPALGRISFTLREGRHRVTLLEPKLPGADPFDIDIAQSWFARFRSKPGFVIDPSRTAVVVYSNVPYSETPMPGTISKDTYHAGEGLVQYPHVDHRFEELPKQVDLGNSHVVYRTQLSTEEINPLYLEGNTSGDMKSLCAMAMRRLTADPRDTALLEQLAANMISSQQTAPLAEFVRTHLADDPPLITWHRVYQNLPGDHKKLIEEYDRLLAAHPQSGDYLYLRGRISDSASEALLLYDRAIAADPNCMFAYLAKSLQWKSHGKYAEAAELLATAWRRLHSDAATSLKPHEAAYFRSRIGEERLESLISAGKYAEFDSVEKETRSLLGRSEESPLVYLSLLRQGNAEAIGLHRGAVSNRLARLAAQSPLLFASQRLTSAMYESDLASMRTAAMQMPEPPRQQLLDSIAFDEGTENECKTVLGSSNEITLILQKLLTSLRCRDLNQPFEESRNEAIKLMQSGGAAPVALASIFQKSPAATIEEVDDVFLEDRERGIILIALAYENPPQKEAMLRYAKRLLTIPGFPQKCLDDWIKRGLGE